MSDSWILIGLTILIVFLLFYISKRLICSGPILTNSSEENPGEEQVWSSNLCDNENEKQIMAICNSSNNNMIDDIQLGRLHSQSQAENRLRSQIFHMILAEKQYQQLDVEASRLARLLTQNQGTSTSPEDYINNLRNEMFPLINVGSFQSQQHLLRLSKHMNGSTNFFMNSNRLDPQYPDLSTEIISGENRDPSSQNTSQNPEVVPSGGTVTGEGMVEETEHRTNVETVQESQSYPLDTSTSTSESREAKSELERAENNT